MSISRRGFLSGMATSAGVLLSAEANAKGVQHFEGYPERYGLLHDTTLCTGCRACEKSCSETNHLPAPPGDNATVFEKPRHNTDQAFTVVNRYAQGDGRAVYRKQQCMHCNEPCCASVCLVHAFEKTPEGPVLYNPDVCIGCRYCVMACPYYALGYEYDNPTSPRVMRCTMCYARVKDNKQPACAEQCPTGAIQFGKREKLLEVARERVRKRPEQYIKHIFGEHELGGTSWLVLAGVPFARLGLAEGMTHESLPSIGTSYLSVVPLIVTIYPGLLVAFHAFTRRKDKLGQEQLDKAVADAIANANDETKKKLEEASKKAAKDKETAVALAVKKALAEAAKNQKEQGS